MDEIQRLKDLAVRARAEPPPRVDVTDGVLREIAAPCVYRMDDRMLWAMAAAAVLAAALALGLAWQDWSGIADPLQGLFGHFAVVMQ